MSRVFHAEPIGARAGGGRREQQQGKRAEGPNTPRLSGAPLSSTRGQQQATWSTHCPYHERGLLGAGVGRPGPFDPGTVYGAMDWDGAGR